MRDKRFVAAHRGGPLQKEQHYQLMKWAIGCSEHVLHLFGEPVDSRLIYALEVARAWPEGRATVGEARKASVACIAVARENLEVKPIAVFVARSIGHAVATAHAADHSMGAAWYALKAVKSSGCSVEDERLWQDAQLPEAIRELVITGRALKNV